MQNEEIKHLAKFLYLTMHQISRHSEMLYEMDTKMFIINNTLQHLMWNIDALCYESNVLHYFQTRIYRVHTSLYALRGDTESLYECDTHEIQGKTREFHWFELYRSI